MSVQIRAVITKAQRVRRIFVLTLILTVVVFKARKPCDPPQDPVPAPGPEVRG